MAEPIPGWVKWVPVCPKCKSSGDDTHILVHEMVPVTSQIRPVSFDGERVFYDRTQTISMRLDDAVPAGEFAPWGKTYSCMGCGNQFDKFLILTAQEYMWLHMMERRK